MRLKRAAQKSEGVHKSLLEAARIDRQAVSVGSFDSDDQDKYWRGQSHEARLDAIKFMRQVAFAYDPVTERLQSLLKIVRPPRG